MQIFIECAQQTKEPNPSISLEPVIFNTFLYAEYVCMARLSENDEHVQNPALRHYTIPLCQTLRSIKSRLTLHSCCVIRFTLDSRPKTSLQQVHKVKASSTTLFPCSFFFFYWSLFHPFFSDIQFKGRKWSCSRQRQLIPILWREAFSSNRADWPI